MANISAKDVQELRKQTGAGMMECKKALSEADGDFDKAREALRKKLGELAKKKADREMSQGWIGHYIHSNGKIGVMVEVTCETDFVAKNEKFQEFLKDLSMQICATDPAAISPDKLDPAEVAKQREFFSEQVPQDKPQEIQDKIIDGKLQKWYSEVCLLEQPFVKDDKKTVKQLLEEQIATIGENMSIRRFCRIDMGGGANLAE